MYKKTYRSDEQIAQSEGPHRPAPARRRDPVSAHAGHVFAHAPAADDEIWHFYMGAACETTVLLPDGTGYTVRLGQDLERAAGVQAVVPRGAWQGTRLVGDGDWALLGTTLAPDFEPSDYEDGDRETLLAAYPAFAEALEVLTGRCV